MACSIGLGVTEELGSLRIMVGSKVDCWRGECGGAENFSSRVGRGIMLKLGGVRCLLGCDFTEQ